MDDHVFTLFMDKMNGLERKVDEVLKFRWQIMGGTAVVSALVGILVQVLIAKYK